MSTIKINTYQCQRCGKTTSHQLFALRCQNCNILMCKKCSKGGLCLDCMESLPEEMKNKYIKSINTPIILLIVSLIAIAIPLAIYIPGLLAFFGFIGVIAYCMDHGQNKTTRKWQLRKAQAIINETKEKYPGYA